MKGILRASIFTILMYGTGKGVHAKFWAEDGPFHTSARSGANIIIIASHSVSPHDSYNQVVAHDIL
jgi:hypothetical protein